MKKILYISSLDPTNGPGAIAMNHYNTLRQNGFNVDFLTLLPVKTHPEIKYTIEKPYSKLSWHQIRYKLLKLKLKLFYGSRKNQDHGFFYKNETEPPVPINVLLNKISNDYDVIIIYFWQKLLSYQSVKAIFNNNIAKPNPKVIFLCGDYSPMTGGCHFVGDCKKYMSGCGNCPMVFSKNPNDFTAQNVKYRKNVIKEIKPYVRVNSYMSNFFKRSSVLEKDANIVITHTVIDHEKFKPLDMSLCRKEFDLPTDKFIILFGCQNLNDKRKGISHLIKSLNYLYDSISEKDKERILLVSIGKDNEELNDKLKFKRHHLGYLPLSDLSKIYSSANVFVSPSIDDAGPTMVNQSIACGTPVVAFEVGSALDVIKDQGTGSTVPIADFQALSKEINNILKMNRYSYQELRNHCREVSLKIQSKSTLVDFIGSITSK